MPAFAMLAVSAMTLASSTYAWFTMNTTVTATGLSVKARAEGGIVIARAGGTRSTATETATSIMPNSAAQALLPTSTANATTWYHAAGTSSSNGAAAAGTMQTLTLAGTTPSASALGSKYPDGSNDTVYVLYDTYTVYPDINSSTYTDLWLASCTVSGATKDLSKSLRVAVVSGSHTVICAPVSGATTSYTVGVNADGQTAAGTAVTALDTSATGTTPLSKVASSTGQNILIDNNATIDSTGQAVSVYVYFEGEDAKHTTENLGITGAVEDLTVTCTFKCSSVSAGA